MSDEITANQPDIKAEMEAALAEFKAAPLASDDAERKAEKILHRIDDLAAVDTPAAVSIAMDIFGYSYPGGGQSQQSLEKIFSYVDRLEQTDHSAAVNAANFVTRNVAAFTDLNRRVQAKSREITWPKSLQILSELIGDKSCHRPVSSPPAPDPKIR